MTIATMPQKSTTVRAATGRVRALRTGLALAQRVAPPVAERWAARLWCTLPDGGSRRIDRRPPDGERTTVALSGGRSVVAETWGDGPPVYVVHGWGGRRGQLGALVQPLVAAGHRVVAHDAPSHGESQPGILGARRSTVLEMAEAVRAVTRQFGAPAGVVTHSLGAVAVVVAMADGLSMPRVVFVAPTVSPMDAVARFAGVLGLSDSTRAGMIRRLETFLDRPVSDFDALTSLPSPRPPALVIHDRDDREVAYDEAVRLVRGWPDSELVTTQGLGHHRLLADPTVIDAVTEYVTRR